MNLCSHNKGSASDFRLSTLPQFSFMLSAKLFRRFKQPCCKTKTDCLDVTHFTFVKFLPTGMEHKERIQQQATLLK